MQLERPHTQSNRQRRSASGDLQDPESDTKAYRFLLFQYGQKLHQLIKSQRNCLGDLEMPVRFKLSREEQQFYTEQLDKIYHKFQDKFTRQAIYRNTNIRKNYQDYTQQYKTAFPSFTLEQFSKNDLTESTNLQQNQNSPKKNSNVSIVISPQKRPLSSKNLRQNVMNTINQAFNGFNNQVAQIFKMKTITAQITENNPEKDNKRLVMSSQRGILREQLMKSKRSFFKPDTKRYPLNSEENNLIFNGSQIVICDKRPLTLEEQMNSEKGGVFPPARFCGKRKLTVKYAQRKSIDEIERMQIQNRIMMANSAISVNATQSQGYKPKSKCWQNYFN